MWNFLIVIFAIFAACNGKRNYIKTPENQFSDTYSVKGVLTIPYAEIKEPFYAWFDLQKGISRIDYYGGMVKTYQFQNKKPYGSLIKIIPVTNENTVNQDTCLQLDGSEAEPVSPQSVLPDIENFGYSGEDMVNGLNCHKWVKITTIGDKVNRYTMWTRSKKSWSSQINSAVPVRYEMKGYNTLLHSHYDHYYLDYEWYSPDVPDDSVFHISNDSCPNYFSIEPNQLYTFNPMKEFVHHYDKHVVDSFEDFKATHNKSYTTDKEHTKRLDLFRQNLRFIDSHNRAGKGFTLGINHLADKNDLELKVLRGNRPSYKISNGQPFPYSESRMREILQNLPDSLDWRLNGAVTPVKDQSVCGSCWSFGTTGAIEGAYFLKHGKQFRASQQALIDCSWGFGNMGCDGGEDSNSLEWIIKHKGIPSEEDYGPYLGQDGYCHVDDKMNKAIVKSYVNVTSGDEDAFKVALAIHGPVSVAIDASHKTFSFYSTGVYYDANCQNALDKLDHAVLVVGYGTLNGEDYWLVKNSWSTYWGNDGYVLMSRKNNNCGVMTDPIYVVM